ncbi:MAG TPA: LysR substrate-binding domain-containing protein [Eoetvoesiella sp.]
MPLLSRALHAFIAVGEELHFGRAAERLHVTQPPLSQQIRRLEDKVGAHLFVRTTRAVRLTPAGVVLLKKAQQMAADAESAMLATRRIAAGEAGNLAIGFTSTAAYQLLPKVLAGYRLWYPDVSLSLKEDVSTNLVEMLLTEKIDLAFLRRSATAAHNSMLFQRVSQENMCVAMPNTHRFAAQREVSVQELHDIPFVGFSPQATPYFRERLQRLFLHFQIQPRIMHESVMPTLLALVEAGVGVALVPESASGLRPAGVCYRPLAGAGAFAAIDLYCAQRRDEQNPAVKTVAKVLQMMRS